MILCFNIFKNGAANKDDNRYYFQIWPFFKVILNNINEDISKNIDLIVNNFGFRLMGNQNNLLWKNENNDCVEIRVESKKIKISFFKNSDKKDKKKKINNTLLNYDINLDNRNKISGFYNEFEIKFKEFFKH